MVMMREHGAILSMKRQDLSLEMSLEINKCANKPHAGDGPSKVFIEVGLGCGWLRQQSWIKFNGSAPTKACPA